MKNFAEDIQTVECIETFTAIHNNCIAGKPITHEKTFEAGKTYRCSSWRPEGMHVDGFFVFHKNARYFK